MTSHEPARPISAAGAQPKGRCPNVHTVAVASSTDRPASAAPEA